MLFRRFAAACHRAAAELLPALLLCLLPLTPAAGQDVFDASWYNPDPAHTYVKIAVVEDGIYEVTGSELAGAGVNLSEIDPDSLRLFENGQQIPIDVSAGGPTFGSGDALRFVGRRHTGEDEDWAYDFQPQNRPSTYYSLYTDTTYYWLSWSGGGPPLRYAAPAPPGGAPAPVETFTNVVHFELHGPYYSGDGDSNASNPLFTRGEGHHSRQFSHYSSYGDITYTATIPTPGLVRADSAGDLQVFARFSSQTSAPHKFVLEVNLVPEGGGSPAFVPLDSLQWTGYSFAEITLDVPHDRIPDPNQVQVRLISRNEAAINPGLLPAGAYLSYLELTLLQTLTAVGGQARFTSGAGGPYQFLLDGFTPGAGVTVYDPVNAALATTTTGAFTAAPAAATTYWAVQDGQTLPAAGIVLDQKTDLASPSNTVDYVVLTTPALMASANEIAAYRSSPAGGGYQTLVLDIDDVFDQFDYGRARSIAVQRFLKEARNWATPPTFLLLWGDALYADRARAREAWEVPSFGKSSSDGWFSMQYDGVDDWSEEVHTGRLSIRSNAEGSQFVQKIQTYESGSLDAWWKKVHILAGGSDTSQQAQLQGISNQWVDIAAGSPFGGDVKTFYKTSRAALDQTFVDSLRTAFEVGTSWMGFFGHSGSATWEISADPPAQWNNAERLPIVLSLGCYNGAFGNPDINPVFAEDVVLTSLNGAIAHWGGTSASFIGPAEGIADPLYDVVFLEGERILGAALTEAKRRYITPRVTSNVSVGTNLQYNLIGCPATRLRMPSAPDFVLTPSQVSVSPFAPNRADGTLQVTATVRNLGTMPPDSVDVRLAHWAPDDTRTEYTTRVPPIALTEDAVFTVPITNNMVGDNRFQVQVDPANAYAEVTELNNATDKTQLIFSTGLTLAHPPPSSYLTDLQPTLRVSLAAQDTQVLAVLFELDTTRTFDSPALQSHRASSALAVEWPLGAPLADGRTYFWRARVDDPTQPREDWETGSFATRSDLAGIGWYQQDKLFDDNTYGSFLRQTNGLWAFTGQTSEASTVFAGDITVNGVAYFGDRPGWRVLVFRGIDIVARDGNRDTTAAQIDKVVGVVNAASPGDVLIVRNNTTDFATFGPSPINEIKDLFRPLGSTVIDTLSNSNHWVMVAKVGLPEETREWVVPPSLGGTVAFDSLFSFLSSTDAFTTPLIGPSQSWDELGMAASVRTASAYIAVDALSQAGVVLATDTLSAPDSTLTIDLSGISSGADPYLRLRATVSDSLTLSTPQLKNWYVRYEPVPELIMDPAQFVVSADSVAEGELVPVSAAVTNISNIEARDVLLLYEVTDARNDVSVVARDTLGEVPAFSTVQAATQIPTAGLSGLNRLTVTARQRLVSEAVTYNNRAVRELFVISDQVPPTYELLIDGVAYPNDPKPITNVDDVSIPFVKARPTIELTIEDNNPNLPLNDTSYVTLVLDGARLSFERPDLRFEPATAERNEARIVFTPDFSTDFHASDPDTTHTLKFWARDVSGNANPTELEPFQIHFRVQTEGEVERVYPYPNPMSTSTTFAFRLRGEDASLVEQFRIRIYTVGGQLIREFDLVDEPATLEAGSLQIGWNKVRWDGTDADGDLLATGVYLYKVTVRMEGETVMDDIEKLVVLR